MYATEKLLERAPHLQRIEGLLEAARGGGGAVLAIEGPAGIGKTELLKAASARAATSGFQVLRARAGHLEADIAFGVARSLLERRVAEAGARERAVLLRGAARLAGPVLGLGYKPGLAGDSAAALHGLYWLCSNLADVAPLMLAVDDVQWTDPASLRWLSYLAKRLEGVPLLLALTLRTGEPGSQREAVEALAHGEATDSMPLEPLSAPAVAELVQSAYDDDADDAFCAACHAASAGNPFFLGEILTALRAEQVEADSAAADRVTRMTPPGVARSVHARLERLDGHAQPLARAIAVLGAGCLLHDAAALAEVDIEAAVAAADAMRAAAILKPEPALDFAHPVVRAAVHDAMPPGARGAAHARAARISAAGGADDGRVAAHLMAADPRGDEWAVERLRAAAQAAIWAGAPEDALAYLRRAQAEPPAEAQRRDILFELGAAAIHVDVTEAVEHFAGARALAAAPEQRAATTFMLAKALAYAGRSGEGVKAVRATLAEEGDGGLRSRLDRELLLWEHCWTHNPDRTDTTRRLAALTDGLAGDTVNERALLSLRAWGLMVSGGPAAQALAAARSAVGPGITFTDPDLGFELPTLLASVFIYCDVPNRALELYSDAIEELRAHGWVVQLAFGHAHRANAQVRLGALVDAEADAALAWDMAASLGPLYPAWWYAFVNYLQVLLARGEGERAMDLAESAGVGDYVPDAIVFPLPLAVRGELRIACGDIERGVEDLLSAGRWMEERDLLNPSWSSWRMAVAPSLAFLGRSDEATELVAEAVRRARRAGAVWALGHALRVEGEIGRSLSSLEESVAVLHSSPARLELSRSLVAYGAALRRSGQRSAARDPLRQGLDLARRCGAGGVERQALQELEAAGARPRSSHVSGVGSLTPSELRVCRLAADGQSNPEIAQALFVTRRTVESHLASAYRKLAIGSRADLPKALAPLK